MTAVSAITPWRGGGFARGLVAGVLPAHDELVVFGVHVITAPSRMSPAISARPMRVSTSRWMKRRSGRAP